MKKKGWNEIVLTIFLEPSKSFPFKAETLNVISTQKLFST